MQTYLVYMRNPWRYVAERRWLEFFSLQLIVGGNIASVLAFHISNLLLLCSIILWLTSGRRIFLLTGAIIIAAMLISMLLGQMLACAGLVKRRQYDLLKWMVLHPAYLFLMGIASQIAVYQLIVKPHYWEKTDHESALQTVSTRSSGIDRRFCNGDRPERKM